MPLPVAFIVTTELPDDSPQTLEVTAGDIWSGVANEGIPVLNVTPFARSSTTQPNLLGGSPNPLGSTLSNGGFGI